MKVSPKFLLAAGLALAVAGGSAAAWASGPTPNSPQPQSAHPQVATVLTSLDSSTESKYTPITPCRIVDTRIAGGAVAAGGTRSFFVAGTTGFAPQGGTSGGCGIPSAATAVQTTVVTVGASGSGYIKAWPYGVSQPTSSFLNFPSGTPTTGGGAVPITPTGTRHLSIYAYAHATHVVIDVQGYYIKPMWARVSAAGSLISSSRATGVVLHPDVTGSFEVDFDRDVSNCSYAATVASFTSYTIVTQPRGGNTHGVYVYTALPGGAGTDASFYLTVTC